MMACACAITVMRLFSAFEIGIDQAIQLEAAERFVRGLGLTSTYFGTHPLDLSQSTSAEYLTWFPPGFSVIVAIFLAIGVPLNASLRILYGSVTLIGWFGWARV